MSAGTTTLSPLDRARRKAFWRLVPICFLAYVVAYVDRTNVGLAKLAMAKDMPWLNNAVFGAAAGIFFLGYIPLEIPGTLIVEKWSARKWISRILVTWGIIAALTAWVKTPGQFYWVRFLLGLAEAGFFPGVIVYLTHWFPSRDRARAVATFLIGTPAAQIISPKITNAFLRMDSHEVVNGVMVHHRMLGLEGWQWVFVFWGIPAVVLGLIVFFFLTDRPRHARWLTFEEREALEAELERERALTAGQRKFRLIDMLQPRVIFLALAYFMGVTASYGVDFFLPSILQRWYSLKIDAITWLVMLPPMVALGGQLFVGWSSDRTRERRMHVVIPLLLGATGLLLATRTQGVLAATVACFMIGYGGVKAYQPAFWALPSQILVGTAAAGSIGLINMVGNLGGAMGPILVGKLETVTGSFVGGIMCLGFSMCGTALIVFLLRLGKKPAEG
jgi:ACS family tartrate transporter-like MFS transporter